MGIPNSQVLHLKPTDYQTKSWKNGKGQTHDIFMFPEAADHTNFDIRLALSPIVEKGVFSSFPGADRVITLVQGEGLNLIFDDNSITLQPLDSLTFDTGLAPTGEPLGGSVLVVNVMARRDKWKIYRCMVTNQIDVACREGDLLFAFAINGNFKVTIEGAEDDLPQGSSLVMAQESHLNIQTTDTGNLLFAHLKPVN